MSYWFVMAIVVIALIAVLIAITLEPDEPKVDAAHSVGRPVWVALGSQARAPTVNAEQSGESWVDQIRQEFGEHIISYDFTRFGATAAEIQRDSLESAIAVRPDVVTLLIGPDDFHDAEPIEVFERRLWIILSAIRQVNALPILSTLPDVTTLPSLAAEDDASLLSDERASWNVAIARLSAASHAELIEFNEVDQNGESLFTESSGRFLLTPTGHQWFAARMIGAMRERIDVSRSAPTEPEPEPGNRDDVSDNEHLS